MKRAARDFFVRGLALASLLAADVALAAPRPVAEMTLTYHSSTKKQMPDGGHLLARCEHIGSGDGTATGILAGHVGWDLYEDQSGDDLHPTQFRGYVEREGKRHPFQIIGVFTPESGTPIRRWKLTGTIVFDDATLIPARHAAVTGYVETGVWRHHYTVWVDDDAG